MHRKLWYSLTIGTASWLLVALVASLGWLERLEQVTWDWRVRWTASPSPATDQIRVVLLDQPSLDWARREMRLSWPWPREVYAPILDFCRRAGALAVGLDMIFSEPSYMGVTDDAALGEAIARNGRVVAAVFIGGEQDGGVEHWPAEVPRPTAIGLSETLQARSNFPMGTRALFPVPEIASNAFRLANVSDVSDNDGVFRHCAVGRAFDGVVLPNLALGVWLAAEAAAGRTVTSRWANGRLEVNGAAIPVDEEGRVRLRFRGPSGTHRTYSAAAVIQSELRLAEGGGAAPVVSPSEFRDKYVFIGSGAPGLLDLRPTPVSRVYPGVELYATFLDNLLAGDFVRPVSRVWVHVGVWILSVVLAWNGLRLSRAWALGAVVVASVALPSLVAWTAAWAGRELPMASPVLTGLAASLAGALVNYATEGRQKAFIQRAFRHYLGPEVIEQILHNPASLQLGGIQRELTMFFSDIEKFSTFSERLSPSELVRLLNEYLTAMGNEILREGGYLDKYIGDAIVAFWNAPVTQPDHAARAVRAALACQRVLAERRAEWKERYGACLRMRIGLNTGEVVVGNMGSETRFNYTVLGDAANLASRLEGANKFFGTSILASGSVRQTAGDVFRWRPLGRIRVVGRATPVEVFEPVGLATDPEPPGWAKFLDAFARAQNGQWLEAAQLFRELVEDPVAQRYAQICEQQAGAADHAWDGVWTLGEK